MGWPRFEAVIWYHTKSPRMGGRSPKELVEDGKEKRVRTFIEELKKEMARE
jgi:hypothetical protein